MEGVEHMTKERNGLAIGWILMQCLVRIDIRLLESSSPEMLYALCEIVVRLPNISILVTTVRVERLYFSNRSASPSYRSFEGRSAGSSDNIAYAAVTRHHMYNDSSQCFFCSSARPRSILVETK